MSLLQSGIIGVLAFIRYTRSVRREPFDFLGFVVLSLGIGALQLMLDRGELKDWFNSSEIWVEAPSSLRARITDTVREIDRELRRDPVAIGESRSGRSRIAFVAPLGLLFRVDIATGKRDLVKQFTPADPAGVEGVGPIQITPDLRYYSYGFARYLTDMYAVRGLK